MTSYFYDSSTLEALPAAEPTAKKEKKVCFEEFGNLQLTIFTTLDLKIARFSECSAANKKRDDEIYRNRSS